MLTTFTQVCKDWKVDSFREPCLNTVFLSFVFGQVTTDSYYYYYANEIEARSRAPVLASGFNISNEFLNPVPQTSMWDCSTQITVKQVKSFLKEDNTFKEFNKA